VDADMDLMKKTGQGQGKTMTAQEEGQWRLPAHHRVQ
jgi:hypothetical protein